MSRESIHQHEGNKYLRTICPADGSGPGINVDVYEVLRAFNVHCPATQHAIKKLLCAGLRRKRERIDDLKGAMAALNRAIDFDERQRKEENKARNATLGNAPKKIAEGFLNKMKEAMEKEGFLSRAMKEEMKDKAAEITKKEWEDMLESLGVDKNAIPFEPIKRETTPSQKETDPPTTGGEIKYGPLPKESPEFPVKYEGETVGKAENIRIKQPHPVLGPVGVYEVTCRVDIREPVSEGDDFVYMGLINGMMYFRQIRRG